MRLTISLSLGSLWNSRHLCCLSITDDLSWSQQQTSALSQQQKLSALRRKLFPNVLFTSKMFKVQVSHYFPRGCPMVCHCARPGQPGHAGPARPCQASPAIPDQAWPCLTRPAWFESYSDIADIALYIAYALVSSDLHRFWGSGTGCATRKWIHVRSSLLSTIHPEIISRDCAKLH